MAVLVDTHHGLSRMLLMAQMIAEASVVIDIALININILAQVQRGVLSAV